MLKVKIHPKKNLINLFFVLVATILIVNCYLKFFLTTYDLPKRIKKTLLLNFTDFHYTISNDICTTDIFLLILIHSAPSHFSHRKLIRDTWGKPDSVLHKEVKIVFLLAAAPKLQNDIEEESNHYQDIVQGNFIDSYHNLTYKHAMGLKWATENCAYVKYLMKMDDDIFIDVFQWLEYITKHISSTKLTNNIACFVQEGMPVVRDPVSKWYVSKKEYTKDLFEKYCSGWAYITSTSAANDIFHSLQNLNYFWVDDVHVTGTAAMQSNISHIRLNNLFDLESDGLADWSTSKDNAMWNKMFAPTWGNLGLSRIAYRKTLQCWVTNCKCCYSRKTTVPANQPTTTKRGIARLLLL